MSGPIYGTTLAAREPAYRRLRIGLATRQAAVAYIFLAPALVFFSIFYFFPIGLQFWASLRSGQPLVGQSSFIGLANYARAFQDARLHNVFWVSVRFSLGTTVLGTITGLGLALLLHQQLRGRLIWRAVIYFPYLTTFVIVALMWRNILDPYVGVLNSVLAWLGLPGQNWLLSTRSALPTIVGVTVWHTMGYNMVLFLAGLQNIPVEFYEAAEIDGASVLARFRHITLPLLAPTTQFVTIMGVIGSLQAFAQAYILTGGGPAEATRLFVFHVFNVAFNQFKFGYASALAFLMFVVILFLTAIQVRLGGQISEY
ncbi:MAG: sugar ABC transporter permease [Anaerolineae bacterium]|nr:sugar ABC transporter permease [Anaerolineae bacterium]